MAEGSGRQSESNDDGDGEATFDEEVEFFAKELVLNAHDIKETYKDQPETLRAYFNAQAQAQPGSSVMICGPSAAFLAVFVDPWTLLATIPMSAALVYADFVSGS